MIHFNELPSFTPLHEFVSRSGMWKNKTFVHTWPTLIDTLKSSGDKQLCSQLSVLCLRLGCSVSFFSAAHYQGVCGS